MRSCTTIVEGHLTSPLLVTVSLGLPPVGVKTHPFPECYSGYLWAHIPTGPPLLQYYDIYAQFLKNTLEKLLLITFSWVIPNKSMVFCSTLLTLLIVSSRSTALTHHFRCLIGVANRPVTNRGRISWIIRNQTLDKLRLTFWPWQACWTVRKPAVGPRVLLFF